MLDSFLADGEEAVRAIINYLPEQFWEVVEFSFESRCKQILWGKWKATQYKFSRPGFHGSVLFYAQWKPAIPCRHVSREALGIL